MAALKAAAAAGAVAVAILRAEPVYADGSFSFPPFTSPASSSSLSASSGPPPAHVIPGAPPDPKDTKEEKRVRNDNPRTSAAGFDPDPLERGAKALKDIDSSRDAKKVFELLMKQEQTRQEELRVKKSEFDAMKAQFETDRQRVIYDETQKLNQYKAQTKAQTDRYTDELARKRMQAEHEFQRQRNQELVKLQEESSIRQEQIRRDTEERIQAQRRQTEREKAEIERETNRQKAMAEAEANIKTAKETEDVKRRELITRANAEREKWIAAINTAFDHISIG